MFKSLKKIQIPDRVLSVVVCVIVALGVFLRIAVFLQNRNLFIDEANVARNIFERGFFELTLPLNYEQYAPPLFLWVVKLFTIAFGYSEFAYRLFPLVAGISSLFLFVAIMKEFKAFKASWYPLFLFATGFIFIQYSTELKQYMVDVLVTLSLMFWALKNDIYDATPYKFILFWIVVGSVSIWLSMPSIFILTGVAAYYFSMCITKKQYAKITLLVPVGFIWLIQFAFYYFAILKPQANSEYLQRYHHDYFLVIRHAGAEQWAHNWELISNLITESSGSSGLAVVFNIGLMLCAIGLLLKKQFARCMLVLMPVIFVFLAASINQFSLIPRVVLFIMPLLLLLVGFGLKELLSVPFLPVKIIAVAIAVICMNNYNRIDLLWHPFKFEQITYELQFLKKNNLTGSRVYVENNVRPAFIYYTQIHPGKEKWAAIRDAHLVFWNVKYDSLSSHIQGKAGFMFTSMSKDQLDHYRNMLSQSMVETDKLEMEYYRCFVYIYVKK